MSVQQFAFTDIFKVSFILLTGNGVWESTCPCRDSNPRTSHPGRTKQCAITTALKINLNQQVSVNRTFYQELYFTNIPSRNVRGPEYS
jgi:hypothetical protein